MDRNVYSEEDPVSITVEDCEILKADCDSDSEVDVSSYRQSGVFSNDLLMVPRLEEGSKDYEIVKQSFFGGLRDFGKNVNVVGIYKKNYDLDPIEVARMKVFRVFAEAVASKNGGDPNLKYAWYGCSNAEIDEILRYGFRRFENGSSSYGHGLYLHPSCIPMESVKTSVADSNGLRHVILCRVILGKPEEISFGSENNHPSSIKFDSGIDNLSSPTKYILWEPYMNTHILPLYVISFRVDSLTGSVRRMPRSPHMGMSVLIRNLMIYLSRSKISLINKLYQAYSKNKISRSVFIRNLRVIAGDDILRMIVQRLR